MSNEQNGQRARASGGHSVGSRFSIFSLIETPIQLCLPLLANINSPGHCLLLCFLTFEDVLAASSITPRRDQEMNM